MMQGHDVTLPLTYFSTGSATLDRILGGGVPERSMTVIAGEPGAGKTVFTLQILFHLARQGYKSLYCTTLSEPALKLIRYMQLFAFFDLHLLDDQCHFLDLGATLRTDGVEPGLAVLREVVEREEPALVAIDSFKAIHDLLGASSQARSVVYDLAVHLAAWDATAFLVGEYTSGRVIIPTDLALGGNGPAPTTRLAAVERQHILTVVRQARGNISQAARVLGIHRATLYRKLVALELCPEHLREERAE